MIVTTSAPHGLKQGDLIATTLGRQFVVRRADAYSFVASEPRWYERLAWWVKATIAALRAWIAWKKIERRLRH